MQQYAQRFPTVDLLDEHGEPTGMKGQVFGKLLDVRGDDTGKLAVMLTDGGQGCKHWPAERCRTHGQAMV
jgi:hypothetical protein